MEINQRATYTLRLNDELKDWLAKRAKRNDRSMNAEIVSLLKELRDFEEGQEAKAT